MNWNSLGSITPTTEWQLYNVPVVGVELFRIQNFWTIKPYYRMRAYLGQFFGTIDEVLISRRIYPFKDSIQEIQLLIPSDFKNAGIITRYIGIKLATPYKIGYYAHDWNVRLDEYAGENMQVDVNNSNIFPGQIPGLF